MKQKSRACFYPVAGWVLTILWGVCLIPLVFYREMCFGAVFVIVGIRVLLTLILTVMNVCFWKKKYWALWITNGMMLAVSVLYLIVLAWLVSLKYGSWAERMDVASVGISGVQVGSISEYDSHDDFLGDGTSMKVYGVSPSDEVILQIQKSSGWRELPLDENAELLLYGNEEHTAYFRDAQQNVLAPQIKEGFWYFENRQAKNEKEQYSTDIFDWGSYNFTIALYDTQLERLYILKLDT